MSAASESSDFVIDSRTADEAGKSQEAAEEFLDRFQRYELEFSGKTPPVIEKNVPVNTIPEDLIGPYRAERRGEPLEYIDDSVLVAFSERHALVSGLNPAHVAISKETALAVLDAMFRAGASPDVVGGWYGTDTIMDVQYTDPYAEEIVEMFGRYRQQPAVKPSRAAARALLIETRGNVEAAARALA